MALTLSNDTRAAINTHLAELAAILAGAGNEIKSPADEALLDAILKLQEILLTMMADV